MDKDTLQIRIDYLKKVEKGLKSRIAKLEQNEMVQEYRYKSDSLDATKQQRKKLQKQKSELVFEPLFLDSD